MICDGAALAANWLALDRFGGEFICTGAAVKADGYGLGAIETTKRLAAIGCRDFFVAHSDEASSLSNLVAPEQLAILHGPCDDHEAAYLRDLGAVPVLNSPQQIARWKRVGAGRCHLMIDTGMNRLGIGSDQLTSALVEGLDIDICMSHLASADIDSPQNDQQLTMFRELRAQITAKRYSLANSAGIARGTDYHFDLTRPGLALYGGIAHPDLSEIIQPVVALEARILQLRTVNPGETIGYCGCFTAQHQMRCATVSLGYADGYKRAFSNGIGQFIAANGAKLSVLGRVSMDLVSLDISKAPDLQEGDWLRADFDLARAEAETGLSQYEWLTHLSHRFERIWCD